MEVNGQLHVLTNLSTHRISAWVSPKVCPSKISCLSCLGIPVTIPTELYQRDKQVTNHTPQHLAAAVLYTSYVLKAYNCMQFRIQTLNNKEHYVLEVAVQRMGLDGSRHRVNFI